jgi:hypothetical protein
MDTSILNTHNITKITQTVSLPPPPVIVLFQGFFARRFSAGYLGFAYFWVRGELGLAVGTLFHPGPPLNERNETNQTNQRTKMNKEESKGKNHKFLFLYELHEL